MNQVRVEVQLLQDGVQKGEPLLQAVEQSQLDIGTGDFENQSRKSCACSDVDHAGVLRNIIIVEQRQAVREVLDRNALVVRDSGEVHLFVPLGEQSVIAFELRELLLAEL